MPHAGSSSSSTEDLASSDEIKVFKDEGDERVSADLTDIKSSLITEGDQVCYFLLQVLHTNTL